MSTTPATFELLDRKDAARVLRVSDRTVIRLEEQGFLKRTKVPGLSRRVLFHPDDVKALIDKGRNGGLEERRRDASASPAAIGETGR